MLGDDELRAQLFRESVERGAPSEANVVLDHIRPTMRRARQRRIVGFVGASLTLVLGVGAVAQVVRSSRDDSVQTSFDEVPDFEGALPLPGVEPSDSTAVPTSGPSDTDDDRSTPMIGDPASSVGAPQPTVDDRDDLVGDDGAADDGDDQSGSVSEPSVVDVSVPAVTPAVTTTTLAQETGAPPAAPPPAAPPTTVAPTTVAPTTVAPTTIAPQLETFLSSCGEVDALVSSDVVEVIDVRPANGYTHKIEDHDHGSVTIAFSGSGEDCELKIHPADRHPEGE